MTHLFTELISETSFSPVLVACPLWTSDPSAPGLYFRVGAAWVLAWFLITRWVAARASQGPWSFPWVLMHTRSGISRILVVKPLLQACSWLCVSPRQ